MKPDIVSPRYPIHMPMNILTRSFFEQPTLDVSRQLIGTRLHFLGQSGIITETEAYIGKDDPACHAAKGLTPRTRVMFGPAGFSYVYLIYGMYHCLNIVTEVEDSPAAVLIRGIFWEQRNLHLNGPGKFCKAWGITRHHNNLDMCAGTDAYITQGIDVDDILITPRIGINVGTELPWRFVMAPSTLRDCTST